MFEGSFEIDNDTAEKIYDILVETCGAQPNKRSEFVAIVNRTNEYRFQGSLGFGGKFWNSGNRWTVSCYTEDETPEAKQMIQQADEQLKTLLKELAPAPKTTDRR